MRKRFINWGQNLILILLTASALFLLSRLPLFRGDLAVQVQSFLSAGEESGQSQPGQMADLFPSVHLVVTSESDYGRCVRLYAGETDSLLRQCIPLFQEAVGSATEVGETADRLLREALDMPSLYLDFTEELPLSVVAAWLGETAGFDRNVRALALSAGEEEHAVLYLCGGEGEIFQCYTALPVSAVLALCENCTPNGGGFAYERGLSSIPPYTILPEDMPAPADIQSIIPAGATAYNLLTALDFNAHTLSRYTSNGVEVVEQTPRTLRISADGTVGFTSRAGVPQPLYQVSAAGDRPTAVEALDAAWRLAEALTEGTDASPLFLHRVEETEDGWTVRFCYQVEGIPVLFPDEEDALTVTIAGTAVTAFDYRCRSYVALEDSQKLWLPVSMAAAISDQQGGTGLSIRYVDSGGRLTAQWMAD